MRGGMVQQITVEAEVERLPVVTAFVGGLLETIGCPMKTQAQLNVAIDELFSNIARYAYGQGAGMVTVRVETRGEPPAVTITFLDGGAPYDPLSGVEPDVTLPAEQRPVGGLGVYLVKMLMDDVAYAYENGQNTLSITKKLHPADEE